MPIYFLQGATLGFSGAVSPGAFQAYLLTQTTQYGLKRTWPMAFAPLLSDGPIIALVLLVLTRTPGGLLRALQIVGGVFLLYLSWGAYSAFKNYRSTSPAIARANGRPFLNGVLVNALNPSPYIFWSVVAGPILLKVWAQSPVLAVSFVGGFYLTLIGGFLGFIILFATASRLGPQVARILNAISALALLILGVYQIWSGIAAP